jgi:molybdopterin/thiamine biosynthesis adenylyltransferase
LASDAKLTPEETRRYARQLVLKGFGGAGQQRLKAASVLIVGAGGLGSPALAYLAGAGFGRIGIVDDDDVSLTNLHRQIVHTSSGVGTSKVASAAAYAHALNPEVAVDALDLRLDAENIEPVLAAYDLVLDGTDNLITRRLVAASAEKLQKPLVSGAVSMFSGQVTVFAPHLGGPGHEALFADAATDKDLPSCEANGILGPVTGIIGTLMAMEAIKLITGIGTPLIGKVLIYDSREAQFTELAY